MLKKTVYFRTQEDLDAFNSIGNKAEWLSNRLKTAEAPGMPQTTPITNILDNVVKDQKSYKPTHYKPTDDWGA